MSALYYKAVIRQGAVAWALCLLPVLVNCAGQQQAVDPDLETAQPDGDLEITQGDLDSDQATLGLVGDELDSQNGAAEQTKQGTALQQGAAASEANGYDDDWNNIGTQQQQQLAQQATQQASNQENTDFQSDALNEEPPIVDAQVPDDLIEQTAAQEFAFEQTPANQTPFEEPPFEVASEQFAEQPLPPVEDAVAPEIAAPAPSGTPLLKQDIMPVMSELFWVGYDYLEREGVVRIEMVTRGAPRYNIFQERNQADQPELVVRFFNTDLRRKIRRDIDASEFRSPVAFVRMRHDANNNYVDVVMTMRDAVQPRLYSERGNVMLSFPLPDHYFGNSTIDGAPIAKADVLPNANVMPLIDDTSEIPEGLKVARAFINNPAQDAFANVPADGGDLVNPEPLPIEQSVEAIPADFDATATNALNDVSPMNTAVNATNTFSNQDMFDDTESFSGNNFDSSEPFNNFDAQGNNAFNNFGADEFNFDATSGNFGGQQPIAPATDFPDDSLGNAPFQESEQSDFGDELDSDSLDNFDDGEGEVENEIDKFDVRLRLPAGILLADLVVTKFAVAAVAQDDLDGALDDEAEQQNFTQDFGEQTGNDFGQSEFGNNNLGNNNFGNNTLNGNASQNFPADQFEEDFPAASGNNLPVNNFGNFNNGAGNFPANETGDSTANSAAFGNATFNDTTFNNTNFNNTGAFNTTDQGFEASAPISETNAFVSDVPFEASPDLSGPEQLGADSEVPPTPSSGGRPMHLDFRGAPLNEVIRALGEESGVNFIYPPEIGQKQIYMNLSGVPFNDALRAILESNALGVVEVSNNLVRIDTLENIAKDREAEERRRKAELKMRPTKILVHRLSYAKAEEAQKMLTEMLGAAAREDSRISVQVDQRSNSVIVNAPPNELATVKALLERIDLETPQVKIASRIVEVNKSFNSAFGISWGTPFNFDQGRGLGFGNLTFPNYMLSRYAVDAGGTDPRVGNFNFRFGSINNSVALDLALSMEETRGTTEILQSSNIIVEDNQDAEIIAGKSDFFRRNVVSVTGQEGNGPALDEVTYNLTMKVKPHITADGAVQMKLNIESDSPVQASAAGAAAGKTNRSITTSLLRRTGETAVIGGIYNTQTTREESGVPFLSSIPIIGALFRRSGNIEEKRELLVMVTPTIINGVKGPSGGDVSFASNFGENTTSQNNFGGNLNSNEFSNAGGLGEQSTGNFGDDNTLNGDGFGANQFNTDQVSGDQFGNNQFGGNEAFGNQIENQQGTNQQQANTTQQEVSDGDE